jgi:hypothetical protein
MDESGFRVRDYDLGAWNSAAGLVRHGSYYAGGFLAVCCGTQQDDAEH